MSFMSSLGKINPVMGMLFPEVPKLKGPGSLPEPPQMPATPPPAPRHEDEKTAEAANEAARRALLEEEERRRRRSATILTSPLGDPTAAPAARKTLLGR